VLAAVDTTDDASEVLSAAQRLSEDHDATLSLVTVIKPVTQALAIDSAGFAGFERHAVKQARDRLKAHAKTLGLNDDQVFVLRGDPPTKIRDLAKKLDAGAIVIGTHGRRGVGLILLGSTANGVLHGADCDVLAVRISEAA
jgi:universal stress protein A